MDEIARFPCPICGGEGERCSIYPDTGQCKFGGKCDICAQYIKRCRYCRGTGQAPEKDREWLERKVESEARSKAFHKEYATELAEAGRRKMDAWNKKYRYEVEWGDEIIAPKQLRGAWIEAVYSPVMGEGMKFDWSNPEEKENWKPVAKLIEAYTMRLGRVFSLLHHDQSWYSPFIIQVDSNGYFVLLHCLYIKEDEDGDEMYNRMTSPNMTLRDGEKVTKARKKEEEKSISIA